MIKVVKQKFKDGSTIKLPYRQEKFIVTGYDYDHERKAWFYTVRIDGVPGEEWEYADTVHSYN